MSAAITFLLSNFTLTFLVIGFVAAAISLARGHARGVVDEIFAWFLFFAVGVSFAYNAVMHTVFGEMAARFIGWADSPFQAEVGFASLGFAVVGFMAFRGGLGLLLLWLQARRERPPVAMPRPALP